MPICRPRQAPLASLRCGAQEGGSDGSGKDNSVQNIADQLKFLHKGLQLVADAFYNGGCLYSGCYVRYSWLCHGNYDQNGGVLDCPHGELVTGQGHGGAPGPP